MNVPWLGIPLIVRTVVHHIGPSHFLSFLAQWPRAAVTAPAVSGDPPPTSSRTWVDGDVPLSQVTVIFPVCVHVCVCVCVLCVCGGVCVCGGCV